MRRGRGVVLIAALVALAGGTPALAGPGSATLADRPGDGVLSDAVVSGSSTFGGSGVWFTDRKAATDHFTIQKKDVKDPRYLRLELSGELVVSANCTEKLSGLHVSGTSSAPDLYNGAVGSARTGIGKLDCKTSSGSYLVEWPACVTVNRLATKRWTFSPADGCLARVSRTSSGSTTFLGTVAVPYLADFTES